ncbi:MAG: peptide-methionine (S)-S-oxide reductase MsrA [Candidatus Peregrinibacteria bacterium]|nr:peptide-methionine (S)-S-oxide reductase MsrA [Candidatus Peregrinibacteria bacterium]
MSKQSSSQTAIFAAGCFWGIEEAFRQLPGIITTEVGYTGGTLADPTYGAVCMGGTGHAEAVHVTFDPKLINYKELLKVFFENHNPTLKNRQGPDIGDQYRSAIFTFSAAQKKIAEEAKEELDQSQQHSAPVVTEIVDAGPFYRAEDYHQQYLAKRGEQSCHWR